MLVQPWWVYKAGNDAHLWSVFRVASKRPNNSCLILVSQKPLQCKGEKDTAGGNQNRDWGRHIRLAQSEELGIQNTGNVPSRLSSALFIVFFFFFFQRGELVWWTFKENSRIFTFSLIFSWGNKKAKKMTEKRAPNCIEPQSNKYSMVNLFSFWILISYVSLDWPKRYCRWSILEWLVELCFVPSEVLLSIAYLATPRT